MTSEEIDNLPSDCPDQLRGMANVSIGRVPLSAFGKNLDGWYKAKPIPFMEELTKLWTAYWAAKKPPETLVAGVAMAKPSDGQECPCCGEVFWSPGCERPLEAAREWLEKQKGLTWRGSVLERHV